MLLHQTLSLFTHSLSLFTKPLSLFRQVLLVGNKQDLEHLREVELHEGEALASQYKIAFSEVIYKVGDNIDNVDNFTFSQVSVAESPDHLIALLNTSVLQANPTLQCIDARGQLISLK